MNILKKISCVFVLILGLTSATYGCWAEAPEVAPDPSMPYVKELKSMAVSCAKALRFAELASVEEINDALSSFKTKSSEESSNEAVVSTSSFTGYDEYAIVFESQDKAIKYATTSVEDVKKLVFKELGQDSLNFFLNEYESTLARLSKVTAEEVRIAIVTIDQLESKLEK